MSICITGTGLFTPPHRISNDELVDSYNQYVENYNEYHAKAIAAGERVALEPSSSAFIEKVSGIKSRYVMEKSGILDPQIMAPLLPHRDINNEPSLMAQMGVAALNDALDAAGLNGADLDGVILACSNFQRPYPAIAIEIQKEIGMQGGFAYDMNVACSAATFGIAQAVGCIKAGLGKRIAMLNVEITSAHLNWRSRDSHFIFGDVATATIIEQCEQPKGHQIIDCKLFTQFSTNIKNEYGFLNRSEALAADTNIHPDINEPNSIELFVQNGPKVFREVCPRVSQMISEHLQDNELSGDELKIMCLHQANAGMIDIIVNKVVGKQADRSIAPTVIDEFANTSSASPMIVFHRYQDRLHSGDLGVICSFGAGYSIGSVLIRKV